MLVGPASFSACGELQVPVVPRRSLMGIHTCSARQYGHSHNRIGQLLDSALIIII